MKNSFDTSNFHCKKKYEDKEYFEPFFITDNNTPNRVECFLV